MKILQLCKKFPYPLKDGESVAVTYLAKALQTLGCEVTLLALNTSKHYFDLADLPPDFDHYHAIHTVEIDNRVKPIEALKALLTGKNYFLSRFESLRFEEKLKALLQSENFDIVQFETLQTTIYNRSDLFEGCRAKRILRAHNVEHEIWERLIANTHFLPKKWYLQRLTAQLKAFERSTLQNVDDLVAISERDLAGFRRFGFPQKGFVTPVGLDLSAYRPLPNQMDGRLKIGFIGSLDWLPNLEGVEWFLEKVLPLLHQKKLPVEFHLAGRNMPKKIQHIDYQRVIVHGEVKSASNFMNQCQVMVVPLFSGSGMRVKILEGMALERVVISTELGAEGIAAKDGDSILKAETAEDFAQKIEFCLQNPKKIQAIGRAARTFIAEHFDNQSIAKKLMAHYEALLDA